MRSLCVLLALTAVAACSDNTGLPDATLTNVERTETLYALQGTPVATPSGFAIEGGRTIRTDISDQFDFAYNLEADGSHVFLPRATLGIDPTNPVNPGFMARTESFEAITSAPSNGYISDRPVPIAVGERYIVRSRVTCAIGVPKYGKVEVVSFDDASKTVAFRVLVDDNCGFKSLKPGLPTN